MGANTIMNKILYFLMVGLAFTALQVVTAEAVKDCAGFTPGTPSFQSCVDANAKAALNNNEGNQSGGDAGAGAIQNNSGTAAPMGDTAPAPSMGERVKSFFGMGTEAPPTGAPGTAPMGAPGTAPMGDHSGTAPMGAPGTAPMGDHSGTAPMGAPGTAPMGDHSGTAPMGAPGTAPMGDHSGTAPMGDPSCAPLANGTLPPHCK
jgi:hypothetical protein